MDALELIRAATRPHRKKPIAYVLAGHNGSGKSTLWNERLAPGVQVPLINADRLTLSILPERAADGHLVEWARRLRDEDERWQLLSQQGVREFTKLVMAHRMAFAFETVFSHWRQRADGTFDSKISLITELQEQGYAVVLLFVGLRSADLSIARVQTRIQTGGHSVPIHKLHERFPRTQQAVRAASHVADVTVMFDNSGTLQQSFSPALLRTPARVRYDIRRDPRASAEVRELASSWLSVVAP